MKRASYREAVAWIANNDSPGDEDASSPETVASYVTTKLIADLFGVPDEKVAGDIIIYRAGNRNVG